MTRSDVTDFKVIGRGEFPFDMLRYDECFPADGESALKLGHSDNNRRMVTLRTCRSTNIHEGRWVSFGWQVVFIDSERYGITLDKLTDKVPA